MSKKKSPMFCPVCDLLLRSSEDVESYNNYDCCNSCFLKWAESRRESWKKGWRPTKKEIDIHRSISRIIHIV